MTDPLLLAVSLAGFLFSQVTSVASELAGPDITPVSFVVRGEEQRFTFFEGKTLEEMVDRGRSDLAKSPGDAWAFAYEGYMPSTVTARVR